MQATAVICIKNDHKWQGIEQVTINGLALSLGDVLIILAAGALIGTWLLSSNVATCIGTNLITFEQYKNCNV